VVFIYPKKKGWKCFTIILLVTLTTRNACLHRTREKMCDSWIMLSFLLPQAKFDVFNALTLLDNPLFLEEQRFGAGDGQLHYYLFNYRTAPILGGVDAKNQANEKFMGGVGVVML